ncbi:MAG: hypothetical protein KatS3mg103_1302 [Phycisphaerales bacterium]|nr:MAG: hypothetical protein KatS3mg103_1302 [Phycisphaerales bacterium]
MHAAASCWWKSRPGAWAGFIVPGRGSRTIGPEASVTQAKRRRLVRILEHLVRANGWHDRPRRIDVVAVRVQARRWWWPRVEVVHYEDAVLAGGQPRGASRPPRSGAGRPPDPPGTDRS